MFAFTECHGDAVAIIDSAGIAHSHSLLARDSDARVAPLGIERRLVAIECQNDLDTLHAYLGCLRAGHVAMLVDAALHADLRAALYRRFGPVCVFRSGSAPEFQDDARDCHLHPDLALLLSTSGSTGSPKLVRLSRRNLQANAESIVTYLGITAEQRAITSLPLHYSYGLSVLNSHLLAGASVVLTDDSVMTAAFWNALKLHAVTSLAGVPATYRMLRQLRFERMVLPQLKTLTQAGGRLGQDEIRWYLDTCGAAGRRFVVMYGQTEATARIAYVPPQWAYSKCGSIGVAIPGGALRLVDAQGCQVDDRDVSGELVYAGENVMLGYATCIDDLARGAELGALHTGDEARRDGDGCYWITGRLSRYVKIHGARFNLDDIETALSARSISAVVAGEEDLLLVFLREPAAKVDAEMLVKEMFGLRPPVTQIFVLEDLPTSAAGKPQYAQLVARYKTGGFSA